MSIYIKRNSQPSGSDAYMLVDEHGEALPYQAETTLRSAPGELPTFTVVFSAGQFGLRVAGGRDE